MWEEKEDRGVHEKREGEWVMWMNGVGEGGRGRNWLQCLDAS